MGAIVYAIVNQKGGVGKQPHVATLVSALQEKEKRYC